MTTNITSHCPVVRNSSSGTSSTVESIVVRPSNGDPRGDQRLISSLFVTCHQNLICGSICGQRSSSSHQISCICRRNGDYLVDLVADFSFVSILLVGCDRQGQTILPTMRITSRPSWLADSLVLWKPVASAL